MTINFAAFSDELEKIAVGNLPAGLSMAGLGGLTAIEGAGAFDKKKSKADRAKDAASAGFTGSILAGEMLHNKKMLKGLLTKRAAQVSPAHQKMMAQHASSDAYKAHAAGPAQAAPALRGQSQTFEPHQLGGGTPGPKLELARPAARPAIKAGPAVSAGPVRSASRPAAQAAGGVMSRIGGLFKKGGVMEDAAKEYSGMMRQHANKPAFRDALHPSERPMAYKAVAQGSGNATRAADRAQNARSQTQGARATVGAPSLAQMAAKAQFKPTAPVAASNVMGRIGKTFKKI